MNERINKLEGLILGAWEQVQITAKSKNRVSVQNALDRVAHLENLKQQEIALENSITASFSNDLTAPPIKNHAAVILGHGKRPTIRPKEVRIGSYRKQIRYAYEIPITVANWLIEQGKVLPALHNFVHPSNSGFAASATTKRLISGQFIEVGDHQEVLLQKARKLFDTCGYQGQNFEVLLVDGKIMTCKTPNV